MRKFSACVLALGVVAALPTPAAAQQRGEQIVVTAMKLQRDSSDLPYVSLTAPADFVVFTLRLETGTRSIDERARELEKSFSALLQRAARSTDLHVEVGDAWESAPVDTTQIREIVQPDEDDDERSQVALIIRADVRAGDTFPTVRARVEKLAADTALAGRTEVVFGDEQYMGLYDQKKHRLELLRRIAEDTHALQDIFARGTDAPAVSLTGLGGRVRTRPSGPLELEMYIPYEVVLGAPQPR